MKQQPADADDTTFYEHITGTRDGKLTDGSLPDGRPKALSDDADGAKDRPAQPPPAGRRPAVRSPSR